MQCNDKKTTFNIRCLQSSTSWDLGELQSIDQQHPIPTLPLEDPVGHQPLDELILLLNVHKPDDLLHFSQGH